MEVELNLERKNLIRLAVGFGACLITSCSLFSEEGDGLPPPVDIVMADSTGVPEGCPDCPRMKRIPGGSFGMGSESGGPLYDHRPKHTVTVSTFWMDSTEVTQAEYLALMGRNPSYFNGATEIHGQVGVNLSRPVERVNWYDAALYCNARSRKFGLDTVYRYTARRDTVVNIPQADGPVTLLDGVVIEYSARGFRLPTEAEWEHACRAGTATEFYWGDDQRIGPHYAWVKAGKTMSVAGKRPNAWGLYDMIGNVSERTNEWFANYDTAPTTDPVGPPSGPGRVVRGFGQNATIETATYKRFPGIPAYFSRDGGFRCVSRL